MFFEINNTTQDSIKLEHSRLIEKKYLTQKIKELILDELQAQKISKNYFYSNNTHQVIEIKIQNIEDYTKNNFSF